MALEAQDRRRAPRPHVSNRRSHYSVWLSSSFSTRFRSWEPHPCRLPASSSRSPLLSSPLLCSSLLSFPFLCSPLLSSPLLSSSLLYSTIHFPINTLLYLHIFSHNSLFSFITKFIILSLSQFSHSYNSLKWPILPHSGLRSPVCWSAQLFYGSATTATLLIFWATKILYF